MSLFKNNFIISGFASLKRTLNVLSAHLATGSCFISVLINLLLRLNTICAETLFEKLMIPAKCQLGTTSDGLQLANCSGTYVLTEFNKTRRVVIPGNLPPTIEVLDLSNRGGLEKSSIFFVSDESYGTVFQKYPKLKRIIQRNSNQFLSVSLRDAMYGYWTRNAESSTLNMFSVLHSLEYFEFSKSEVNTRWTPMNFPPSLKTINMSENALLYLNLKMCPILEEVNVNQNRFLQSVPLFHVPTPPIKTLRMKGCPLPNMTILDIAPLCELTLLELEFPSGSYYLKEDGYCHCVLLKRWIDLMKLQGVRNLNCKETNPKQNCDESVFKEAENLRKKCPLLHVDNPVLKNLFGFLKYIFFAIICLLLVAVLILYIIRHFHLREYWAAHHAHIAAMEMELDKMDEEVDGEEPLNESLNESVNEESSSDYSVFSWK